MVVRTIMAGDVRLASEAFGESSDPAVLLIMGAMASSVWWPDHFCRELAARGRHVIRYDHRDTGASTSYPPGTIHYTVEDLADDALAVLDAYGVTRAHLGPPHSAKRAFEAMLTMRKIDIATIEAARRG